MSTVGISFGSATSGTGFDVATTVSSIMAVERTPETAWATRTTTLQAQDTVLSTLGTEASALSSALATLTSFDGVFSQKTGATSDTAAVVLTNVTSSAEVESHTLTVQTLAQTSKDRSNTIVSGTTLSGTLKLTVGSGTQQSVFLDSGSTVKQIASRINSASVGVTASVITDSSGSRLTLTSGTSGAGGEVTIDSSGVTDSTGTALSFTEVQPGVDAAYTLDGASLTSSSNTISTALTGVTFQLVGLTSTSGSSSSTDNATTLQIAADTSSVSTALSTFVSAYNTLAKALTAQEGKDSSGNAEPMFGSPVVQQLQSGLAAALSFVNGTYSTATGATQPVSLATLGITAGTDGTLTLDTSALSSALSSRLSDITTFFQTTGYFGQNFATTLNNLGSTGAGALGLAISNNTTEESTLADNKTALEARLSVYQTNLTTELTTANEILQAIPSTLKGITALFDAITGNTSS